MTHVEYYTKNKKVYHYEPTAAELEEIQARREKQLKARLYAAKKEFEQSQFDHRHGYCPRCFLLIPHTGTCPNCN